MNANYLKNKCKILAKIRELNEQEILPCIFELSVHTGLAETTVHKHVRELEKEGFIEIVLGKGGRKNVKVKDLDRYRFYGHRFWSEKEVELLKKAYCVVPTPLLAKALGRSVEAIKAKWWHIKHPKTNKRMNPCRGRMPKYLLPLLAQARKGSA